jgi:hypothetical protein
MAGLLENDFQQDITFGTSESKKRPPRFALGKQIRYHPVSDNRKRLPFRRIS